MGRPGLEVGTHGKFASEKKNGVFWVRTNYRDLDLRVRPVSASSKVSAADAERKLKKKLNHRPSRRLEASPSFASVRENWWSTRSEIRVGTIDRYASLIRLYLAPTFDDVRVASLTTPQLEEYIQDFVRRDSPGNARSLRTLLVQILGYAERMGHIPHNPAQKTSRVRTSSPIVRALTVDEVHEQRRAARRYVNPEFGKGGPRPTLPIDKIIDVMAGTGLRIGEVLALRRADINLDRDDPTITCSGTVVEAPKAISGESTSSFRQDQTKTPSGLRTIPIPNWLVTSLEEVPWRSDTDLLFATKNGNPYSRTNVRRSYKRLLTLSGSRETILHDMRKTVGTNIEREEGLTATYKVLGQSGEQVAKKHYVEKAPRTPDVRHVLEKFATLFED